HEQIEIETNNINYKIMENIKKDKTKLINKKLENNRRTLLPREARWERSGLPRHSDLAHHPWLGYCPVFACAPYFGLFHDRLPEVVYIPNLSLPRCRLPA
ncbi:MAG: hypothetical protein J6J21_03475, partial [Clostridia bacterium]|nr:hypothetical protein [Clostridia bacterium]